ncbi:hypothetical protein H8699_09770 [Christensenellaceae bacterium NSJ-44]|uniref:Uncharacterized protein n=1 Tax=Luoshenia tenuis TaxID=2763654 RepID=A0A926HNJ2_9FIRM|nr:hypothetical protein [Luoshenia tenuis]MBC8529715.1 hypothetical protein [Luoshenia tenuis]
MTGRAVFRAALGLLGEGSAAVADYEEEAVLAMLNATLCEVQDVNNGLRLAAGLARGQALALDTLDGETGAQGELERGALPFALAARLALTDEETTLAAYYNALYVEQVNALTRGRVCPVRDVY